MSCLYVHVYGNKVISIYLSIYVNKDLGNISHEPLHAQHYTNLMTNETVNMSNTVTFSGCHLQVALFCLNTYICCYIVLYNLLKFIQIVCIHFQMVGSLTLNSNTEIRTEDADKKLKKKDITSLTVITNNNSDKKVNIFKVCAILSC